MKNLFLLGLFCFALTACDNNTDDNDSDNRDTTVIIHKQEETKQQETTREPEKKPEKTVRDWKPLMAEYHQILCRQHKKQGKPNDKIRQVELAKELEDIRRELNNDQKFTYTADMAKAVNMEDC